MPRSTWAILCAMLGIGILLWQWSPVARWMTDPAGAARAQHLSIWSATGDPDAERTAIAQFERNHPDIEVSFNPTSNGQFKTIINMSFLSGSPPDVFDVPAMEMKDYVAKGLIRPIDDLIDAAVAADPGFLGGPEQRALRVVRFRADPTHPYLVAAARYPAQAARLLAMDGRAVGLIDLNQVPDAVLTYNQRVFREAAAWHERQGRTDHGLTDANGEAVPPRTWTEMLEKAKLITAFGAQFLESDRIAGVLLQGQRTTDVWRGIKALLPTTGTNAFDYAPTPWLPDGRRGGRFAYDHPGVLAAIRFQCELQKSGVVLPGTPARQYEEPRTLLAQGRAGMLLDGPHTAKQGTTAVPMAKGDVRVARVPLPDAAILHRYGIDPAQITPSLPGIELGGTVRCISADTRAAGAAFTFLRRLDAIESQIALVEVGHLPTSAQAGRTLMEGPEHAAWRAATLRQFQRDLYDLGRQMPTWPSLPLGIASQRTHFDIAADALREVENKPGTDTEVQAKRIAAELAAYNETLNADLARRVQRGDENPLAWTSADYAATRSRDAVVALRSGTPADPQVLDGLRARLPEWAAGISHGYLPPWWGWHLLAVLGIALLLAGGWLAWRTLRDLRRRHAPLAGLGKELSRSWHGYALIAPAALSLLVFVIYPGLYQCWLATMRGDGIDVSGMRPVGLANFQAVLLDGAFWGVVARTLLYMAVVAFLQVAIGLLLALLLALPLRGMQIYRTAFFVPMVVSVAAMSAVFYAFFAGPDSLINTALGMDPKPDWLGNAPLLGIEGMPSLAFATVVAIAVWSGLPHNTILLLAGLQSVDPALHEAARVDGANAWRRFWNITLPSLKPIVLIVLFNALVGAAMGFTTVYTMTEGGKGTDLVSTYIFRIGLNAQTATPDVGKASAYGLVYALLLAGLTGINAWLMVRRWRARLAATGAA